MDAREYGRRVRIRRQAAGLSQRQLADLAGIKQPYVTAIEAGRRVPSGEVGEAIDRALDVRPSALLRLLAAAVAEAVARVGASNPRVFGSVARGVDQPGSDVDLLVTFPPGSDIVDLLDLEARLSEILTVEVDVIPDGGRGPVLDRALAEAVPL